MSAPDDGKATHAHHYANEAMLRNWVMFGGFDGINRDDLSKTDLALLSRSKERTLSGSRWVAATSSVRPALPGYLMSLSLRVKRINGAL
jgi:hypothetical protein